MGEEIVCENMKIFYSVQGERRFFRVCFHWLATQMDVDHMMRVMIENGMMRWDDIFSLEDTTMLSKVYAYIKETLLNDLNALSNPKSAVSLCAKWMPSINTSSQTTRTRAQHLAKYLDITERSYRKMLALLRERIHIVERLMSQNRWNEIEFDKLPSRAGLIYRNTFMTRDETKARYEAFANSKDTKVNAGTLYPYDCVHAALQDGAYYNSTERKMVNKYWENLTDYFKGATLDAMVVCDTSGSMCGTPIEVAISLALYTAERASGPFHNHYISFSRQARLIETTGNDFVEKVHKIFNANLCENTNLESVFDLVLTTALQHNLKPEDLPKTLIIVSDMEIDRATSQSIYWRSSSAPSTVTTMGKIRETWKRRCNGKYAFPNLIYWNVDARQNTILDSVDDGITYVSGCSPVIYKQIIQNKSGIQIMLDTLNDERYKEIY